MKEEITVVNIGKNGLTESVYKEVTFLLEKKGRIKVKILKSATDDRKAFAKEIAEKTDSVLENLIGFVCTLRKRGLKG